MKMNESTYTAPLPGSNRKHYFKDLLRNRIIMCCFRKFSPFSVPYFFCNLFKFLNSDNAKQSFQLYHKKLQSYY